jgi:hypothetical protein
LFDYCLQIIDEFAITPNMAASADVVMPAFALIPGTLFGLGLMMYSRE